MLRLDRPACIWGCIVVRANRAVWISEDFRAGDGADHELKLN